MSDPVMEITTIVKDVALWLAAALFGILGYQLRSNTKRIDEVEKTYVAREEFNDTVTSIRTEIKEGNRGTHERLDRVLERMADK